MAMGRIKWDETGEHVYETGAKNGVLYVYDEKASDPKKAYGPGVAWNGLSSVSESPSGAEANAIYADDIKYLNLYSAEEFAATVEAYTYPDEFGQCDGSEDIADGVSIGQQGRKMFGFCYRTTLGNDIAGNEFGYKLHLIYGCKASPSEKSYTTINDSPEAITFSWEINTTPVNVTGKKPTSTLIIDSTKVNDPEKMKKIEDILYGTESTEAYMPLPDDVIAILTGTQAAG